MIITLRDTQTSTISEKIDTLHEERGEVALGRVLTLLILTDEDNLEDALRLANEASLDHPCRVIAITPSTRRMTEPEEKRTYLDAEVRIGADAGAGEIIVLRPRGGLIHHQDTLVIPCWCPTRRSWHGGPPRRRPIRRRTSWGRWRTAASPTQCARRTRCARWRTCAATGRRRTSTCRGRA